MTGRHQIRAIHDEEGGEKPPPPPPPEKIQGTRPSPFDSPLPSPSMTMATPTASAASLPSLITPFLLVLLFSVDGEQLLASLPGDRSHPPANETAWSTPRGGAVARYLPAEPAEYRPSGRGSRRVLAPFQLCLDCRCCVAGDQANCSSMPCCFGINCDLPNKPFGVCAFVPKTCDCTSCG